MNDSIFKAMYRGLDDNNDDIEEQLIVKQNFLDFYKKYCNKESKLGVDDIHPFNLTEDEFFADSYNDVAYLTSNYRLIVLFEHQSTYNPNMPSRLLIYYCKLIEKFLDKRKHDSVDSNLYKYGLVQSSKVILPVPEFYVLEVFDERKNKRTNCIKKDANNLFTVHIDSMFDENDPVDPNLFTVKATIIHFNTIEAYNRCLNNELPKDLINEFSLFYAMFEQLSKENLDNNANYKTLLQIKKTIEDESERKKYSEQIEKIRNTEKVNAAKQTIKILGEKGIFKSIINRMGESRMVETLIQDHSKTIDELEDLLGEYYTKCDELENLLGESNARCDDLQKERDYLLSLLNDKGFSRTEIMSKTENMAKQVEAFPSKK